MKFDTWCGLNKLKLPEKEYRFHPDRKWRFDYAWVEEKIAVEIEGGIYGHGKRCPTCGRSSAGAHSSISGIRRDIEKYNNAVLLGWKVLRFTPQDLISEKTISMLKNIFKNTKHE